MEVRPGYKRTEVGVIPEEWEVKRIADIADVRSGGTPSRENPRYWNGEIPWVTTAQLDFKVIHEADQRITPDGLKNSAARLLPPGTILMAMYGQGKTRGKVGILGIEAATNQACASIAISGDMLGDFVFKFLESRYEEIRSLSNSGSQENLSGQIVREIPVVCPPLPEQRAIATALSEVDALLTQLDRLIAKKRDIKQAAMQQLLTGKTRLPGFGGSWRTLTFGELGTTYGGLVGKSKADFGSGDAQYVTFLNVMSNSIVDPELFDRVRVTDGEAQNLVRRGDLLFNGSSETPEEVGMCALVACDVPSLYLNSFCFGLRLRDDSEVNGLFLSYLIRGEPGRNMMKSLAQGSTRYNISKAALRHAPVSLPELQEQTAIATLLSDLDAELAALEARRDKTRALKQGMMQALLTGKTRLI
jgi:type I restriction enzyme S subunit